MKIVQYAVGNKKENIPVTVYEETVEDAEKFEREFRRRKWEPGTIRKILNVTEQELVPFRDKINEALLAEGYHDYEGTGVVPFKTAIVDLVIDTEGEYGSYGIYNYGKTAYLAPAYEEVFSSVQDLAERYEIENATKEVIAGAFHLSENDYFDFEGIHWDDILTDFVETVSEPEYSYESARIGSYCQPTGWDYAGDNIIETEYPCLSNYDEMVKQWKSDIIKTAKEILKDFRFVGMDMEEFFDDEDFLVDAVTKEYPMPSKESVEADVLQPREPDYDDRW